MATVLIKNWKVKYSIDERLDRAFDSLEFIQTMHDGVSEATHTFEFYIADGNTALYRDQLPKIIEELKKTPWTFTITDALEKEEIVHTHVLKDYEFHNAMRDANKRTRFVMRSVELKALMHDNYMNQSWDTEGGKMEKPIPVLVGRHGLTVDPKGIEPTDPVPEWSILRQANYTDLEFVRYHLVPRSKNAQGEGGFQLWTKDGKTAWYCTSGYNAKKVKIDPKQIIRIEPEWNQSMQTTFKGGNRYVTSGVNPFTKRLHPIGEKSGVDQPYGNTGPSFDGSRYEYQPFWTEQALTNWRAAHQGLYNEDHYPFLVRIHGTTKIGDEPIVPPLIIDLTGTKFRAPDTQKGPLFEIRHTIKKGIYTMLLHCIRHKIDY